MSEEIKDVISVVAIGIVSLFVIGLFVFYIAIEIPRMRHESITQQLYNRCLASQGYSDTPAAKNCAYILNGTKNEN